MPTALVTLGQPASAEVQSVRVTLWSEHRSGFRFYIDLLDASLNSGYRIAVIAEWRGENIIDLPVCALKAIGQPSGWASITSLRLCSDETAHGDVIEVKSVSFSASVLPRPISPYEDAIETFFLPTFWQVDDWDIQSNLPPERRDLQSFWFWAQLIMKLPAPGDWITMERHYPGGISLAGYDALITLTSFETTATCSIELKLDGTWQAAVTGARGLNDFHELIADVRGAFRLEAVRLRMECRPQYGAQDMTVLTGIVSWMLLQRAATDPLVIRRHSADSTPMPAPRAKAGKLEEEGLAAGLFLSREDIPALRHKANHGLGHLMWQKIKSEADKSLAYDPELHVGQFLPIRRGESLTRRFVEAAPSWEDMIPQLGVAYLVTGDEVYGQQLKRVLLAACRCAEWGTAFIDRFPVGIWGYRAPFWPSHMAAAVAVGTDMISNLLSDEERAFIDQALIEKGLFWVKQYIERNEYCRYMNQGAVFATGGILAALVAELRHPELTQVRRELAAYLYDVLDRYLDEDGATGEGPSYWNYTLSQAIRALAPLARRDGTTVMAQATPKLAGSISYPFYLRSMAGDGATLLNIGDGGYGYHVLSSVLLFFASHLGRPDAMHEWLDQYGHEDAAPSDAWSLLFYNPDIEPQPLHLPLTKHFRGSDRVFWRSGWQPEDILFMFESGNWGPDHYHLDKQQFLLEAFSKRMIVDRGMCDYSNPLSLHLHKTASHNTVTVDGRDQTARSRQSAARLEKLVETAELRYLSSEAGAAYDNLVFFRREVLFVRARYFVLADTLAGIRGKLVWHFHTPLHPQPMIDGLLLRGQQCSLMLTIVEPQPWTWTEELLPLDIDVAADHLFNRLGSAERFEQGKLATYSDHHLMLTTPVQTEETRLLAILFPIAASEEHRVKIKPKLGETGRVVSIEHDGWLDELTVSAVWQTGLLSAFCLGDTPG